MRASKYRHVFGQAAKRELSYENLKITKNAWDLNIITTNGTYLAVNWDALGGGAFAVIPLSEVGKAPDTVPLFRGHKGPVLDTAFNPFDRREIASCADDGKILVWEIPDDYSFHHYVDADDNVKDVTEPKYTLAGHTRKVGHVEYHPCAANVLASCLMDYTVKIWNLETQTAEITLPHPDLVTSFAFNYNGTLLATTARDKRLRIWDLRSRSVVLEGPGHTGAKPSRVVWLGNTDRIATTGFSRLSDRQVGIWDVTLIEKGPIGNFLVVDALLGVLIPVYDESNGILYLAGKGDGNIRYFEYDADELYELLQYALTDPQRGFATAPKIAVNLKENEILRAFKTVNDNSVEPISFIVPRKLELFQEDIYPDAPSDKPAIGAKEWFAGNDVNGPLLVKMEALYDGSAPEVRSSSPAVSISKAKAAKPKEPSKDSLESKKPAKNSEPPKAAPERDAATPPADKIEAFKRSEKVDTLLNKVEDQLDDEDAKRIQGDEWEEITPEQAKPETSPKVESPKVESPKAESPKVESPKVESPRVESPKEVPFETAEPEAKTVAKSEENTRTKEANIEAKADAAEVPGSEAEAKTEPKKKATLTATVDRLAALVDKLEAQISRLEGSIEEKVARINALEAKVDKLG